MSNPPTRTHVRVYRYYSTRTVWNSTSHACSEYKWEMADHFNDAVEFAAQKLGLPKLKSQQSNALRQFVQGHDLFVNLPTGFGKSIIFQAAPIILDF